MGRRASAGASPFPGVISADWTEMALRRLAGEWRQRHFGQDSECTDEPAASRKSFQHGTPYLQPCRPGRQFFHPAWWPGRLARQHDIPGPGADVEAGGVPAGSAAAGNGARDIPIHHRAAAMIDATPLLRAYAASRRAALA